MSNTITVKLTSSSKKKNALLDAIDTTLTLIKR